MDKFAADTNRVLVINGEEVLDVTTFAKHHPGGSGLILNYKSKDISHELKSHHVLTYRMADSLAIGSFSNDIKRVIDPEKPLMGQIWNIDHQQYLELVNSPHWLFVDSPRMFHYDIMEFNSHNKWYHILVLHLLFTSYLLSQVTWANVQWKVAALVLLLGIFSFSLLEYILHRWLFHSENYLFDNKIVRYLHFMLHGIHHMLPVDPDRLVFPPVLAAIFIFVGYHTIYGLVFPTNRDLRLIYWVGLIYGYICYDMIHYALHHVGKSQGYFGRLQRYHNQHHYSGENAGYGVSSKLWDIIFRTELSKNDPHREKQ